MENITTTTNNPTINSLRIKCIEQLQKSIVICFDMDGYYRFSGEVMMAYRLGLITEEEKWTWLDKSAKEMRKANGK